MTREALRSVHRTAVEVYGAFLEKCVVSRVAMDRDGPAPRQKTRMHFVDGRPVRLLTISGKGGWSPDSARSEVWAKSDNISLLDHVLSVARGALMFWLADAVREVPSESEQTAIEARARALVSIAFLHDIDKDLGLSRGAEIAVDAVAERMSRYGIDEFLAARSVRLSPAAMLNYVEQVEGTQAAATKAAPDFDRRIAAVCPYVELADKLEGAFARDGVEGVRTLLERWQGSKHSALTDWAAVEVHDHLHGFLLDELQTALSEASLKVTGLLPLIEVVHDGRLLCLVRAEGQQDVKRQALKIFLKALPYGLRFAVNNRLACEFIGGSASWKACRKVMEPDRWEQAPFANLLALPRTLAQERQEEIDLMFSHAGMATSWVSLEDGAPGASAKPAIDHPGGDPGWLEMEPAHALTFLAIALNHKDEGRGISPDAASRERQLSELLERKGQVPPQWLTGVTDDDRARRVLLAIWTVAAVWRLEDEDHSLAAKLLDSVLGVGGLVHAWIDGGDEAEGLARRIRDTSGEITEALERRFGLYLGRGSMPAVDGGRSKRCILCNEPVSESGKVSSASRVHGVKVSAFSGRDGRNDHLARPGGDTHLCSVCLAELQLRSDAQRNSRMGGDLPPLVSSPVTTGLFGGLAYQDENTNSSLDLHDLNRLDVRKGRVYHGLDCQRKRIRVARLEPIPTRDEGLVEKLVMMLKAVRRLGRPIHIFRGAPSRHPGIWHFDALPPWLVRVLGGNSLRIEQLPQALRNLELFDNISKANGLGVEWAKRALDPCRRVRLGALCVAWGRAVDQLRGKNRGQNINWATIEIRARERALSLIDGNGGGRVNLSDSDDPLVRLAWLASRIQRRRGSADSTNKQLLCWKTAMDFVPAAERSVSKDETALILGLAARLEEDLRRGGNDAAARKHRDGEPLNKGCIDFATHFVRQVWGQVFGGKEPVSQQQRHAAAIYRFSLLESYSARGIPEPDQSDGESDR